ncbi:glycosyltransferase family 4 protein [Candidatus Uhrbacteria bacterium]|nr:glycosyltransferase family 4 protein [Candidatus Uhrbacteria bacterium]
MRTLILRFPFSSAMGGTEKHTLALVDSLSRDKNFKFSLASNCPILKAEFKKRGLPVYKVWAGPDPVTPRAVGLFLLWAPIFVVEISFLLLYLRLFKKVRRLYCLTLTEKLLATLPAKLLGYKVFWVEHTLLDNWLTKSPLRLPYRWFSRYAKIIAVSYAIKKQALEIGVNSERVCVIHNGIDSSAFITNQMGTPNYKRTFVLGTVCRLSPEKGVNTLLQALKIIQDIIPNVKLIVVGDGPEKNSLLWLTQTLNLQNRVQFVGWQDNAAKWISNFDLFILPSLRREAFGQVLLEAMALSKAVVASRVGGIPEVVEQNKTGLLVEAGNHEMLALAVINLYNKPEWIKELGENGRKRVIEQFSWDKTVSRFFELML